MLTFVRKRYRKSILNFRHYPSVIAEKLTTPFAIGAIVVFFIYFSVCYYALNILLGLIYDEEVAETIDFNVLFILPMLLAATLYLNLVVIVKIVWARFRRSPGTLLLFRIISFFLLSIILPGVLFILVFDIFFDRSIAIFDNQAILRNMENKKWTLGLEVDKLKIQLDRDLEKQLATGFSNFNSSKLTYVGVHDLTGDRLYYHKINSFSIQSVPNYSFDTLLSSFEKRFTSYDIDRGFVYQVVQKDYQGKKYLFNTIIQVSSALRNDIQETFMVIRQVKQFGLLIYPFKIFTIIFLIYIYFQVFSVMAIVFYYSANRYISPIAALIKATREVLKGNYKTSLFKFTKRMGDNEIKELLRSFSQMTRDLTNYRQRLERITNIEAWKDVSQKLAHEIKNPLTPILLAKDQIERYLVKNDFSGYNEMRENFLFIETEIKRIITLLNEFNILSQQKLIHLDWVDTREIMSSLQRFMGNYKTIQWVGEDRFQKPAFLDKDKIMRVLINLIGNSIDSLGEMKKKKEIDPMIKMIVYNKEAKDHPQTQNSVNEYGDLIFEIWDNGVGIPKEKRNEVFKPYVTFKESGTGLGLAICDEIISLHQGKIETFSFPFGVFPGESDDFTEENDTIDEVVSREDNLSNQDHDHDHYWTVFRITLPYNN